MISAMHRYKLTAQHITNEEFPISPLNNLRVPAYWDTKIPDESLKKQKKKTAAQQELSSSEAEYTHLSSLDGHGKSVSTQVTQTDASLQITKQMSKWAKRAGHAQHLVAHPLHTASQIPPYVTWLFVHTIQMQKRKKKRHIHCSVSQVLQDLCVVKVCYLSTTTCGTQERERWVKLAKRL